jgi:hypothetical protein
MKYLYKLILLITLSLIIVSCEKENEVLPQTETLILKFENSNEIKSKSKTERYTVYEVNLDRNSPLEINNDNLELKKIINKDTGKIDFIILEKSNTYKYSKSESTNLMQKVTKRRGFQHDGGNCWVVGTWWEDDVTGFSFFQPAPAVNQVISNVCGWDYDTIA